MTLVAVPNTAMAVTIDIGETDEDIHPKDKQDVGKHHLRRERSGWRMGRRSGVLGPMYELMSVEADKVRITKVRSCQGLEDQGREGSARVSNCGEGSEVVVGRMRRSRGSR